MKVQAPNAANEMVVPAIEQMVGVVTFRTTGLPDPTLGTSSTTVPMYALAGTAGENSIGGVGLSRLSAGGMFVRPSVKSPQQRTTPSDRGRAGVEHASADTR